MRAQQQMGAYMMAGPQQQAVFMNGDLMASGAMLAPMRGGQVQGVPVGPGVFTVQPMGYVTGMPQPAPPGQGKGGVM